MGTWQELKDRRLFQIVVAYLAGGWLVLEGIGLLVEQSVLPDVAFGLTLVAYVAGIPTSVVLGWYHGEKGQQRATPVELVLLTTIGAAALAAGVVVFDEYGATEAVATAGDLASTRDARQVAVLYFEDRSPDARFQHVADGLTEGLIEELSRVGALDVVSANGAADVRESDLSVDSVATLLDVGTVIRGSVEPEGGPKDRLRVSFGLVDGLSGTEFRRESLVWPADSLAAARTELARQVARLLREWLGEEIRLRTADRETRSSAAWALVQRAARSEKAARAALRTDAPDVARARYAEADSLLARAATVDPGWSEPPVRRGWIALEHAQPGMSGSTEEAGRWLDAGLDHAARALEIEPRSADALVLRGALRYRQYQFHITPEGTDRSGLLELAREDLEAAVDLNPSLAAGYVTLSSLYYQTGDFPAAVLAARQAYQRDYYLRSADDVLWRLFSATYDLEDYNGARRWCDEGRRRFDDDWRFVECRLWLMTMAPAEPDIDRAWTLYDEMERRVAETRPDILARARAVVGGIIGRASLAAGEGSERYEALRDSADRVLRGSRTRLEVDPEQDWLWFEAAMRSLMGDRDRAVSLLERYSAANPGHFGEDTALQWWWDDLRGHPGFERIRELQTQAR